MERLEPSQVEHVQVRSGWWAPATKDEYVAEGASVKPYKPSWLSRGLKLLNELFRSLWWLALLFALWWLVTHWQSIANVGVGVYERVMAPPVAPSVTIEPAPVPVAPSNVNGRVDRLLTAVSSLADVVDGHDAPHESIDARLEGIETALSAILQRIEALELDSHTCRTCGPNREHN